MNVLRALDRLLRQPKEAAALPPLALLAGAIACYILHGLVAGFFQGGWSIALAVLKVPLIILGALALCAPSLYVFTALAGAEHTPRSFASVLAAFCGIAGLLLVALMPVIWLFSVSTLSLTFLVWLHLIVWMTTLVLAHRILAQTAPKAEATVALWLLLLLIVSLQVTTYVRPVLWRDAGQPLFATERKSFLQHLVDVGKWDEARTRTRAAAAAPAPPR